MQQMKYCIRNLRAAVARATSQELSWVAVDLVGSAAELKMQFLYDPHFGDTGSSLRRCLTLNSPGELGGHHARHPLLEKMKV